MPIVYRLTKGSPLTHAELDGNFQFLTGSINAISGTYATTGSNVFNGNQTLYGNLAVFGTASFTFTTSSITTISASTFGVSIASPTIRFGRYDVLDSGASISTSSFAWDSTNTRWIYSRVTGSVSSSAIFLTGPLGSSGPGNETALSQYRIPVSNGNQSLSDSFIYSNGANTTISGALAVTNVISIGNVINSSPQYGKFLVISGSYPGVVLGHSNVGKAYSFGVGDFSQFFINDDNSSVTRLVIESNGWFGLGKSATTFLDVSGSTNIDGRLNVVNGITGSLLGTSSYATQALNASTASLATTASFALTASFAANIPTTSSYALQALNANTASLATTASYVLNAISSSVASTASFLRPLIQSVIVTGSMSLSGSLNVRNTAATTTFSTIGRSGSLYLDLNGVGNNYIDGNALFIRNSAGTTNLVTVSGSRFIVSGSTELSGSLSVQRADGDTALFISSSISSSSSTSVVGTTASFNGNITFTPGGGGTTWNTNLDIYYSGNSGSGHTNLSPVSNQVADNNSYSTFTITLDNGITLTPSGSIPNDGYSIWVYASGSINKWYEKTSNDIATLGSPGLIINISGPDTDANLQNDLLVAGFANVSDPNPYTNNINVISTTTTSFTSSLIDVKGDTTITGSLRVSGSTSFVGTHTLSGSNTISGNTVMSGSIIVSGSTTFSNTTFTVTGSQFFTGSSVSIGNQTIIGTQTVTGSQFFTGSSEFRGNQTITGSLSLQSNGTGTGLYINGQKQFNYISVFHTASILPTQNVSGAFVFSNTAVSSSISVISGSRITFANTGIYNIQFSAQLYTQTGATVHIWLKRNGTNITNSTGRLGPTQNGDYLVPAWNYVDTFTSGSYVEIAYETNQTNTQFQYVTGSGNYPAAPSIIASVTQVA